MKLKLIQIGLKFLMCAIAIGVGIWYLSSSLDGAAITYSSMGNFLGAIGAKDGDVTSINGCFLCSYMSDLFEVLGNGAELFWSVILGNLWILLAVGFGAYLFIYTINYLLKAAQQTTELDTTEKKLALKEWFDNIWKQGARVLFVGVFLGMIGSGGTQALKTVANITITPVLYVGAELSMMASNVSSAAECPAIEESDEILLGPVAKPFMCVIGNINSIILAGAAGGFALMNFSWLGLGGGALTWCAGLGMVLLFLIIGFNLVFQIISVLFKLVFIIVFLPLLVAATAFEKVWKTADGLFKSAINMIVTSAIQIVAITLKVLILYATIAYAADAHFPGPIDNYSAILPPMMMQRDEDVSEQTMDIINAFQSCESSSMTENEDGEMVMDPEKFATCFNKEKAYVEKKHPGAFDFMENGFEFLLMCIGLYFLYIYVVEKKINGILIKDGKEMFDFGSWVKDIGKTAWNSPKKLVGYFSKAFNKF